MSLKHKNYKENHNIHFIRLYWKSDKEKINSIIDRIPDKYLNNLIAIWRNKNNGYEHHSGDTERYMKNHSIICRYDGYEFYVSLNNLVKRIPSLVNVNKFRSLWKYQNVPYKEAEKIVYGE